MSLFPSVELVVATFEILRHAESNKHGNDQSADDFKGEHSFILLKKRVLTVSCSSQRGIAPSRP